MPQPVRQKAGRRRRSRKPGYTARTADRHELYEKSVQDPEADIRLIHRVFVKRNGRPPLSLREDFCGTAYLCAEWVRSRRDRVALGLDLDRDTMEWGTRRHLEPLGPKARGVKLLRKDVRSVTRPPSDVCVAFNFSYCIFKDRRTLLGYFKKVRRSLAPDGAFVIDLHGGPEAHIACEEETRHRGFIYVWDQDETDPLTHHAIRHIHFRFPDGTRMKKAFHYDWRVWSLPELRDLYDDAGFAEVEVYWEGYDKDGDGNGIFRKVERAKNDDSWIAYMIGWK